MREKHPFVLQFTVQEELVCVFVCAVNGAEDEDEDDDIILTPVSETPGTVSLNAIKHLVN